MTEGTPYVGFSNETLGKQPPLKAGDEIGCPTCGEAHEAFAPKADDGSTPLLFYRCGEETFLAGVGGKNVAGVKPDVSGKADL